MKSYSIKAIEDLYGVSQMTVLAWIHTGQLAATNVARKPGGRPRWRISEAALEAFELRRMSATPAPRAARRRKPAEVIQFYA